MRRARKWLLHLIGWPLVLMLAVLASVPMAQWYVPDDLLPVSDQRSLIIEHVNVVDVAAGRILSDQQVLIRDGIIESIAPATFYSDATLNSLDANGAYLLPGLVDMHVHLHDRKYLAMYLAHGVTTVRNMRGYPMHLRWRKELLDGDWLGSNLITASPVLDGEKYAHLLQQVVEGPDHARQLVRQYHRDGYDLIKAYGYLPADAFMAIKDEAKKLNMPVAKHGPNAVEGAPLQSNAELQSLEHVEDIFQGPLQHDCDTEKLRTWLQEFAALKPVVTPTLATFNHLTRLSDEKQAFIDQLPMETLSPFYRWLFGQYTVQRWLDADPKQAEWNRKEEYCLYHITRALHEQQITLLVGSDGGTMYMPPGSSTLTEIALLSQAGIPTDDVLRAATINAAMALGIDAQYGSIAVGKTADLLLVADNPLTTIATLETPLAVVKNGQWLDEKTLAALRESGKHPNGFFLGMGLFLDDQIARLFD